MSYSRNKYRCLLKSNQNVIVSNDNNIKPKPMPHIYPYDPYIGSYPYGYPNIGPYSYPSGYPNSYLYGYPNSYPSGYPIGYPIGYPYSSI